LVAAQIIDFQIREVPLFGSAMLSLLDQCYMITLTGFCLGFMVNMPCASSAFCRHLLSSADFQKLQVYRYFLNPVYYILLLINNL